MMTRLIKQSLVILLLMLSAQCYASNEYDACFESAGQYYNINYLLLKKMASVESDFDPKAENKYSKARGILQIHPWWFSRLEKYGIKADDLWDACTNIYVGAWILAQEQARYGNTWTAIGAYYAGAYKDKNREERTEQYIEYAKRVYSKLYGDK